jgi:hypothetical protein
MPSCSAQTASTQRHFLVMMMMMMMTMMMMTMTMMMTDTGVLALLKHSMVVAVQDLTVDELDKANEHAAKHARASSKQSGGGGGAAALPVPPSEAVRFLSPQQRCH